MGRILIISDKIEDIDLFISSLLPFVKYLVKSPEHISLEEILNLIDSSITEIGFVYHNENLSKFPFGIKSTDIRYFNNLFRNLIGHLDKNINVDLLTCNLNDELIKNEIDNISKNYNINIRYSLNETGSQNGDWNLESHNINIKKLYFNDQIDNWNYVLYFTDFLNVSTGIYGPIFRYDYDNSLGQYSLKREYLHKEITYNGNGTVNTVSSLNYLYDENFQNIKYNPGGLTAWGDSTVGGSFGSRVPSGSLVSHGYISVCSNSGAFAAIRSDGSVVCWGNQVSGGTMKQVLGTTIIDISSQLTSNVISIYSTSSAFAALKTDGSVVAWGSVNGGGSYDIVDSTNFKFPTDSNLSGIGSPPNENNRVVAIYSNSNAFAALKKDGSVVTWGHQTNGGSYNTRFPSGSSLTDVVTIYNTQTAFAALKKDGSVITWGSLTDGGSYNTIYPPGSNLSGEGNPPNQNNRVIVIYSNSFAFAALKKDGTVITWGNQFRGGNYSNNIGSPIIPSNSFLTNVVSIYSIRIGFAALRSDKSVIVWGGDGTTRANSIFQYPTYDVKLSNYALSNVAAIYTTGTRLVTLLFNGRLIISFLNNDGSSGYINPSSGLIDSDIKTVISNRFASAAIKTNGSVVVWGVSSSGGDLTTKKPTTSNLDGIGNNSNENNRVISIYNTNNSFLAIKNDNSTVAWGPISTNYTGIRPYHVYSTDAAFVALSASLPPPPINVIHTIGNGMITFEITHGPYRDNLPIKYRVSSVKPSSNPVSKTGENEQTTIVLNTGLVKGLTYQFGIRSITDIGESTNQFVTVSFVLPDYPDPPTLKTNTLVLQSDGIKYKIELNTQTNTSFKYKKKTVLDSDFSSFNNIASTILIESISNNKTINYQFYSTKTIYDSTTSLDFNYDPVNNLNNIISLFDESIHPTRYDKKLFFNNFILPFFNSNSDISINNIVSYSNTKKFITKSIYNESPYNVSRNIYFLLAEYSSETVNDISAQWGINKVHYFNFVNNNSPNQIIQFKVGTKLDDNLTDIVYILYNPTYFNNDLISINISNNRLNTVQTFHINNFGSTGFSYDGIRITLFGGIGITQDIIPPSNFTSSALSTPSINLSWTNQSEISYNLLRFSINNSTIDNNPISLNSGNEVNSNFNLSTQNKSDLSSGSTLELKIASNLTELIISNLPINTKIYFRIRSVNTISELTSEPANTNSTTFNIPTAPTNIVATTGLSTIEVSFSPSLSNGGSAIKSYTVISTPDSITQTKTIEELSGNFKFILSGFSQSTNYTFIVYATNDIGNSPNSSNSNSVNLINLPGAPTNLIATEGDQKITISFNPPTSNGGSAIISYSLSYMISGSESQTLVNDISSPYIITGLTNGSIYSISVYATNIKGNGPSSTTISTPKTIPNPPISLQLTPNDSSILVTFSPPLSNGGSPITRYDIEYISSDIASPIVLTNKNSPTTISGLDNGKEYTITVIAYNIVGASISNPSSSATPRTIPNSPTDISAIPDDTKAIISFKEPTNNGGANILSYTIRATYDTNKTLSYTFNTSDISPVSTIFTINFTGLTNGVSYIFDVIATNIAGNSLYSTVSSSIIPFGKPAKPILGTVTVSNRIFSIPFTAPNNNGREIINYQIKAFIVQNEKYTLAASKIVNSTTNPITYSGLYPNIYYVFSVAAENEAGYGSYSDYSNNGIGLLFTPIYPELPVFKKIELIPSLNSLKYKISYEAGLNALEYLIYNVPTITTNIDPDPITANIKTSELFFEIELTDIEKNKQTFFKVFSRNNDGISQANSTYISTIMTYEPFDSLNEVIPLLNNTIFPKRNNKKSYLRNVIKPLVEFNIDNVSYSNIQKFISNSIYDPNNLNENLEIYMSLATSSSVNINDITSYWSDNKVIYFNLIEGDTIKFKVGKKLSNNTTDLIYTINNVTNNTSSPNEISSFAISTNNNSSKTINVSEFTGNGIIFDGLRITLIGGIGITPDLPQPSGLESTTINNSTIKIDWDNYTSDLSYFVLTLSTNEAMLDDTEYSFLNSENQVSTDYIIVNFTVDTCYKLKIVNNISTINIGGFPNNTTVFFNLTAHNSDTLLTSLPSNNTNSKTFDLPGPPTDLIVTAGNKEVNFSFKPPVNNGGTSITSYKVIATYNITSTIENTFIIGDLSFNSGVYSGILTGLTNGTTYNLKISAINSVGNGPNSSSSSNFIPVGPPEIPSIFSIVAGDKSVIVVITPPSNDGGSGIISYTISNEDGIITKTENSTTITMTGLTNGSEYRFKVLATNNLGSSNYSSLSSVVIPYGKPEAPSITVEPGDQLANITLTLNGNNGREITLIRILSETDSISKTYNIEDLTLTSNSTEIIINLLTNGTSYVFKAQVYSEGGWSELGIASAIIPFGKPSSPSLAIVPGDQKVTITITPGNSNGRTIDYYKIFRTDGINTNIVQVSDTIIEITGLTNGTEYQFKVLSHTEWGESDYSSLSSEIIPFGKPSSPSLSVVPGDQKVTITITPGNSNGRTIDYYKIYRTDGVNTTITQVSDTSVEITGLTNGTEYQFKVLNHTEWGESDYSNLSSIVIPFGKPLPPTITNLTGGNKKVSMVLTTGNGNGRLIEYYRIFYTDGIVSQIIDTDDDSLEIEISGLTNGIEYQFKVLTHTEWGDSDYSLLSSKVKPFGPPESPTFNSLIGGNHSVTITINPPANNGGYSITSYTISIEDGSIIQTFTGTTITITDNTKLINGNNYRFKVLATNVIGSSEYSELSNYVMPVSVPDAPNILTVIDQPNGAVLYIIPNSENGSPITDFIVKIYSIVDTIFGQEVTLEGMRNINNDNTFILEVKGLTNGVTYKFKVIAVNSIGNSPESEYSDPIVPSTVPGKPTIGVVSVNSGIFSIPYTGPIDNGGSVITGYKVQSYVGGVLFKSKIIFGEEGVFENPILFENLFPNVEYTFRIAAINKNGLGPLSDSSNLIFYVPIYPELPILKNTRLILSKTKIHYEVNLFPGENAIEYIVEKSYDSENGFDELTRTTDPKFIDEIQYNIPIYYKIFAVNSYGTTENAIIVTYNPFRTLNEIIPLMDYNIYEKRTNMKKFLRDVVKNKIDYEIDEITYSNLQKFIINSVYKSEVPNNIRVFMSLASSSEENIVDLSDKWEENTIIYFNMIEDDIIRFKVDDSEKVYRIDNVVSGAENELQSFDFNIEGDTSKKTTYDINDFGYDGLIFDMIKISVIGGIGITPFISSNNFLPCFTSNTMILTPNGYKHIIGLKNGDMVKTDDGRNVKIVNIYKFNVNGDKKTYPFIIPKHCFKFNYPPVNTLLSGGHCIKVGNKWTYPPRFGFKQMPLNNFDYYHIQLPNYATDNLVINYGLVVESYGVGKKIELIADNIDKRFFSSRKVYN